MRGKACKQGVDCGEVGDHPRLCGEKSYPKVSSSSIAGSPPPMRGKAAGQRSCKVVSGITPAYAGKSEREVVFLLVTGDHPRLCGEKFLTRNSQTPEKGSPPPMRGKAGATYLNVSPIRITPAYAGKSSGYADSTRPFQDHPRLCGEKSALTTWQSGMRGSPPPMRGKGYCLPRTKLHTGITPAYAGKRC